jgi:hypothetical protein
MSAREILSHQQLFQAAKIAGQILYGKGGADRGTHGSHFSFKQDYEVREVSPEVFAAQTLENESYELFTFDPYTKKPLWTNASPDNPAHALPGADDLTAAGDGKIYVADQHWSIDKTIIYVIQPS